MTVSTGDYILAINGEELKAPDNIYRLLDGTANRQTVLTVNTRPAMDGARQVTVVPVANEQALAHARLGGSQPPPGRQAFGRASSLTSMCPAPASPATPASIAIISRSRIKLGAIIDERYNSGGSAADYIIDVLAARFRRLFQQRGGRPLSLHQPVGRNLGAEGDDHQ